VRRVLQLALLIALATATATAQPAPLRVRLFWTRPPATIELHAASPDTRLRPCPACPWSAIAQPVRIAASGDSFQLNGAAVAGPIDIEGAHRIVTPGVPLFLLAGPTHVQAKDGRLLITTEIPLEDYSARVLTGESGNFTAHESLKAMAVAVRTFAVRNRGRHVSDGFDLCDTTHCQDLRLAAPPERLVRAAVDTEGELLWYEGRPAALYYHRDCGGHTESAHEAWPGERFPYLLAQPDPYCASPSRPEWRAEIRKSDLAVALRNEGIPAPQAIESVVVQRRTASGRASELLLAGSGSVPVRASALRLAVGRQLGWTLLRSDQYAVRDNGNTLLFQGRGAGHGVGLCQTGAARMGEAGKNYHDILAFYFPGTRAGITAQGLAWRGLGSARIELLTTQPREDGFVVELADRLLRDAEARFGQKARVRPQLRVYPSVEVYRDATGQPGWMAASTRGRVVRLQPVEMLRRRGTLEATLRHELLHVVVESHARSGLPLWFREGLVLYFSDPSPAPASAPDAMNTAEIERILAAPRDLAELERAHAAARARVAALVQRSGIHQVTQWVSQGLPQDVAK